MVKTSCSPCSPTQNDADRGPATELVFVAPKSKTSRRTVPLIRMAVEALRVHRVRQNKLRLQSGLVWEDRNLVFTTEPSPKRVRKGGMPLDDGNLTRDFHQALERAELPGIRFHELRHTCASLLLAQGVDLKVVQTLLGHADFYLTANT